MGGYKTCILEIKGEYVYSKLKYEVRIFFFKFEWQDCEEWRAYSPFCYIVANTLHAYYVPNFMWPILINEMKLD